MNTWIKKTVPQVKERDEARAALKSLQTQMSELQADMRRNEGQARLQLLEFDNNCLFCSIIFLILDSPGKYIQCCAICVYSALFSEWNQDWKQPFPKTHGMRQTTCSLENVTFFFLFRCDCALWPRLGKFCVISFFFTYFFFGQIAFNFNRELRKDLELAREQAKQQFICKDSDLEKSTCAGQEPVSKEFVAAVRTDIVFRRELNLEPNVVDFVLARKHRGFRG